MHTREGITFNPLGSSKTQFLTMIGGYMWDISNRTHYGHFGTVPPKACIWGDADIQFFVTKAYREDGKPVLIVRSKDILKFRSQLCYRLRKRTLGRAAVSAECSAANAAGETAMRAFPENVILFCEGRKFAFRRFDACADTFVFWPRAKDSESRVGELSSASVPVSWVPKPTPTRSRHPNHRRIRSGTTHAPQHPGREYLHK
jgi:hypothetical protein